MQGRSGAGSWGRVVLAACVLGLWLGVLLHAAPGRDHYLSSADHAFQLALGQQVLFGKVPGVDVFNAYGPLVMYVSALGLGLSGSLVGETIACAIGHALALLLVFGLVARAAGPVAGLVASGVGYLALARFYKWYVWLLPLAVVQALVRWLEAPAGGRRGAGLLLGLALGLTALFRPDLGVTCSLASAAVLVVALWRSSTGQRGREAAAVVLGIAVPVGVWLSFLVATGGLDAVVYFVRSTVAGGLMVSQGMSRPLPSFDPMDPFSPASLRVATLLVMLASYGAGAWIGARGELAGRGCRETRVLLASAAVGLGIFHQGVHRSDGLHLLQVVAPWVVCAVVLAARLVRVLRDSPAGRGPLLQRALVATWALGLLVSVFGVASWGRSDLAPLVWQLGPRYRELAAPLETPGDRRILETARRISAWTRDDDAILVFLRRPQLYALTGRRLSGKIHAYYPGVYASEPWSGDNLRAIEADPPKLVVVPRGFLRGGEPGVGRHGELRDWLRRRYRKVLFEDETGMLLAPGRATGNAAS